MRARGDERWRGSGSRGLKWVAAGLLGLALMARPGTATAQEELAVVDTSNNSVTVYARTASGDVAPLRTLSGGATGLNSPAGLALDLVHDFLTALLENAREFRVTIPIHLPTRRFMNFHMSPLLSLFASLLVARPLCNTFASNYSRSV